MTKTETNKTIQKPWAGTRRGDGGTYLIIADGSDEFAIGAHYACRVAHARRGYIAVAHITDLEEFVHWGKVETMMRNDMRAQAEQDIWQIAKDIHDDNERIYPSLYIREGRVIDKIMEIIDEDISIRALILAGSNTGNTHGPLVSHFSGKGMNTLRVPVIIIPGHLDKEAINAIT
jgi:hypothetical protein